MRQKFMNFMAGRNGNDKLNMFLLMTAFALMILSAFFSGVIGRVLSGLVLALLILSYFRMFSRNIYKRREENEKYLKLRYKVMGDLHGRKERWVQRKDYKFFSCPACKTMLRVPRGHGKLKIVCRKCGNSFIGKT